MKRRVFLKNTAALSAFTILKPGTVFSYRANSAIQMGIIGCGGRGTAVISSISANTNTNIIAMADIFEDKLKTATPIYNDLNKKKGFPAINQSAIYRNSKAYL